jgi:hypothetical protein
MFVGFLFDGVQWSYCGGKECVERGMGANGGEWMRLGQATNRSDFGIKRDLCKILLSGFPIAIEIRSLQVIDLRSDRFM